ncbi:MAG TPA: hypothetical protein DCE02_01940 [Ruminiclostridium sp.]|uniref:cohesin domain-containing protein n=1 Tax=Acetivibrio saccincola TaxID=1677857 RepID=UPI000EEAD283|nr:cohesin domain-containing protein [Acetivibrio saccincola]NLW28225.1 hypothetical protein [Acetivibrio saccincola]HAA42753.1 hypothetical protein [Ruminiclostridium sp.]
MKKIALGLVAGVVLSAGVFAFAAANQWVAVSPNFKVLVRGDVFESDPPPVVIEGRTYLPLRAMAEALDVDIYWDGDAREVLVDMGVSDSGNKEEPKKVKYEDISIKSDTIEAKPGDTIKIPVKFSNVPSEGINSGFLKILFDNDKLEVLDVVGGEIMNAPEKDFQFNIMNEKGAITLLYVEAEQQRKGMITKDGTFITIEAKVKENASEGSVKLSIDSGNFEDYDFNPIGLSPSLGEVIIKK